MSNKMQFNVCTTIHRNLCILCVYSIFSEFYILDSNKNDYIHHSHKINPKKTQYHSRFYICKYYKHINPSHNVIF